MKLLFVGDLQLGAGLDLGFGEYGEGSRFHDQEQILDRVAKVAEDREVDLVAVLGDVFERAVPKPWEILAFQTFVRRLVYNGKRVLVIVGNHDVKSAALPTALSIFAEQGVEVALGPTLYPLDELVIAALPWAPTTRLLASVEGPVDRDRVNELAAKALVNGARVLGTRCEVEYDGRIPILVGHWSVEGAALPTGIETSQLHEPVLPLDAVADSGFRIAAFGHIHKPQVLAKEPGVVFYTGSPQVCDWGEAGFEHGVWLYDSAGAGALKFQPVEDRPFLTIDLDAAKYLEAGPALVEGIAVEGAFVRVKYECDEEQARRIDHGALRASLTACGARKVVLRPKVSRAARARVAAVEQGISEDAAFDLWLHSLETDPGPAEPLVELHREYLRRVTA